MAVDAGNVLTGGVQGLTSGGLLGDLLGAGSSLLGGLVAGNAASSAGSQQAAAEQAALDFTKKQYGEAQTNLNPYIQAGQGAEGKYSALVNGMSQPTFQDPTKSFQFSTYSDPNAQYDQQQSAQAINASALGRGAVGGGEAKALQTNASNLGNTAYQGAYGRYLANSQMLYNQAGQNYQRNFDWQNNQIGQTAGLANQGQSAASTLAGIGQGAAGQVGNIEGNLGSAQAGGTMGQGNALANGISAAGTALGSAFNLGAGRKQTQQPGSTWQDSTNQAGTSGLGLA